MGAEVGPYFWVDVVALSASVVVAASLLIVMLGAIVPRAPAIRQVRNYLFAAFVLMVGTWATLSLLLRLSLWLDGEHTRRYAEWSLLALGFSGPLLLGFAAHYAARAIKVATVLMGVGLLLIVVFSPLLFQHRLLTPPNLVENGSLSMEMTPLGMQLSLIPALSLVGGFLIFWLARRDTGASCFTLGIGFLLTGILAGGLLDLPLPLISPFTLLGLMTLGYVVVTQQLLNPLREQALRQERELEGRKRIESALRESQDNLQTLFNSLDDFLVVFDEDGIIVYHNPLVTSRLRYSELSLSGFPVRQLFPAEMAEEVAKTLAAVIAGERQTHLLPLQVATGERIAVESKVTRGIWSGRPVLFSISRDITQRKRAQEEIMRLQHLLQNVTDSMPSALIALDEEGHVLLCNPASCLLIGLPPGQALGKILWGICPSLKDYQSLVEQVILTREEVRRDRDLIETDEGIRYREISIFPLAADGIAGAVLRVDDVTQRAQLEEMMLQSAKMASVGGLAAGVAHEINNPLGVMMQSAQMVQRALDARNPHTRQRLLAAHLDPAALMEYLEERGLLEYLQGIRDTGARAAKIVSDLLSFSRRSTSDFAPRNLNTLLQRTMELAKTDYDLKKHYDFRNIEIVWELAPDLPDVMCDGQQVQQVILNLVRNAAQAMAELKRRRGAEYQPRLVIGTRREEESVLLTIEDNGPGIDNKVRARLFEPFFTTKDVGEGTGLGLWMCWSIIVERHKGRIWVDDAPEGGSIFAVELPLTPG